MIRFEAHAETVPCIIMCYLHYKLIFRHWNVHQNRQSSLISWKLRSYKHYFKRGTICSLWLYLKPIQRMAHTIVCVTPFNLDYKLISYKCNVPTEYSKFSLSAADSLVGQEFTPNLIWEIAFSIPSDKMAFQFFITAFSLATQAFSLATQGTAVEWEICYGI